MRYALPLAALMLLAPTGLLAQTTDTPADAPSDQATASDQAADAPADAAAPDTQSDAAPAPTSDAPASSAAINAHFTLDTPIKVLVADPGAKAVLDKDMPGLSTDENLDKFSDKSLRQFQPMTGGQLTDDLLKKTGADLAAIGGGDAAAGDSQSATDDSGATPAAMDAATDDAAPAAADNSADTTDDAAPPADDKGKTAGNARAPEGR